jgi:hypothetical protein
MRVASRTRNGPTLNLSLRKKRKTSLLVLEERPSVSASASRSRSSTLTSASSRPPSAPVDVAASEAAAAAVVTDHPVVAEARVASVEDVEVTVATVAMALEDVDVVVTDLAVLPEAVLPSTPTTSLLSPAWDRRPSRPRPYTGSRSFVGMLRTVWHADGDLDINLKFVERLGRSGGILKPKRSYFFFPFKYMAVS